MWYTTFAAASFAVRLTPVEAVFEISAKRKYTINK
jgi:hypothetical protein